MKAVSAAKVLAQRYGVEYAIVKKAKAQVVDGIQLFDHQGKGRVCCPPVGHQPPKSLYWSEDGEVEGRKVYVEEVVEA